MFHRASRLRRAAAASALLVLLAPPVLATTSKPPRPDLKLRVSTHHGYLPLDLELTGTIQAADRGAFETCLLTVEWSYLTPARQNLTSKKEIPCVEPEAPGPVPESFKKKVLLDEPGVYSYRLVLASKEGKRYASASQEVKVIKSRVEVSGATVTND